MMVRGRVWAWPRMRTVRMPVSRAASVGRMVVEPPIGLFMQPASIAAPTAHRVRSAARQSPSKSSAAFRLRDVVHFSSETLTPCLFQRLFPGPRACRRNLTASGLATAAQRADCAKWRDTERYPALRNSFSTARNVVQVVCYRLKGHCGVSIGAGQMCWQTRLQFLGSQGM